MATKTKKKWSAKVTKTSDAMDLKKGVFKQSDPAKIARSVKASAARSKRKKGSTRQSAMSMLSFYINRAGKNLSAAQKKKLEKAKDKLKKKDSGVQKKAPPARSNAAPRLALTPWAVLVGSPAPHLKERSLCPLKSSSKTKIEGLGSEADIVSVKPGYAAIT